MTDTPQPTAEEVMEKVREIRKQCPHGTLPFQLPIGLMRNICDLCQSLYKENEELRRCPEECRLGGNCGIYCVGVKFEQDEKDRNISKGLSGKIRNKNKDNLIDSLHKENEELRGKVEIAKEALKAVANDEEQGKWGPDITTASHAREALFQIS